MSKNRWDIISEIEILNGDGIFINFIQKEWSEKM
jgi:hypothetical protein